jgi:fibronectin type 3 domain-containing protein
MSYPLTLQPGQTATLTVQFDPTVSGAAIGAVALTTNTNTSAGAAVIALSGTGATAAYQVDVSWNAPIDSTDPVAGYDVYRAVSGSSSYELLNSSLDDATSYTDTTVQEGVAYTYYIVSVDASGDQSDPSNLFSVTVP